MAFVGSLPPILEKTQLQEGLPIDEYESPDFWGLAVSMQKGWPNHKLRDDKITFGRAQKCSIQVAHPAVSGLHCVLSRDADGVVTITDMSSNGTFVKGERLGYNNNLVVSDGTEVVLMKSDQERIAFVVYLTQRVVEENENAKQGGPEAHFDIRETLGSGGFATVKLCIHRRTGQKYAIKCIERVKALQCAPHRDQAWMDEIDILRGLDHPNIVKIFGVFQTQSMIYIVLELLSGGDLFDCFYPFVEKRQGWPEMRCLHVVRQIVRALAYLHGRKIVHRDLKLENILLAEGDPEWPTIKLTDFGLARIVDQSKACVSKVGTELYVAPEVAHQADGQPYDKQVDVWALGVVTHILLVGVQPHIPKQRYTQEMFDNLNYRQPWWKRVSPEAKDLVKRMLCVDPQKRITVAEIPHHEWFLKNPLVSPSDQSAATETIPEPELPQQQQQQQQQHPKAMQNGGVAAVDKLAQLAAPLKSILDGSASAMPPEDMMKLMQSYLSNPKMFPHPNADQARALFEHAQQSARQLVRAAIASDADLQPIVHPENDRDGTESPSRMDQFDSDKQISLLRSFFSAAALGAYQMSLVASAPEELEDEPAPFEPGARSHFPNGPQFVPVPIPVPIPVPVDMGNRPEQAGPADQLFESLMSSAAQRLRQYSTAMAQKKRRHDEIKSEEHMLSSDDEAAAHSAEQPPEPVRKRLRGQAQR